MSLNKYDFQKLGLFNNLIQDFLNDEVNQLISNTNSLEGYSQQISTKKEHFSSAKRSGLVDALRQQYKNIDISSSVKANINALEQDNTYTITTGHQLSIFAGPLYLIYKICEVIKTARQVAQDNKGITVVPVFWMASEDHDFEEIASFNLFGQAYTWSADNQNWPVGRMPTNGLESMANNLQEKFQNDELGKELLIDFEKCYHQANTLKDAVRLYLNNLFEDYGLVILDGDDKDLKASFSIVMQQEVKENVAWNNIKATCLNHFSNYKVQVNPRFINLFYIHENNVRARIDYDGEIYQAIGLEKTWSKDQLIKSIKEEPWMFSPNVVMRTVYQEHVLPNLSYVGGAGEISYWLELKSTFEEFNIPFPILKVRNSFTFLRPQHVDKINQWAINIEDIYLPTTELIDKVLDSEFEKFNIDTDFVDEYYDHLLINIKSKDPNALRLIEAEKTKALKGLQNIESKVNKTLKNKHESKINQVKKLKSQLFPNGSLQERHDNILHLYGQHSGKAWLDFMINVIDAYESKMIIT